MIDPTPLLVDLVRTPSPSGDEGRAAGALAAWASDHGLDPEVDDTAVRIRVAGPRPGPTLLMASHLDTVPPGDGWSVAPYDGVVNGGQLIARGAVDAKASVSSMAAAAATLAASGNPAAGELIVLATYSEETRDTSMPRALQRLGTTPDAAIVGEPTSLEPCIAQRGQLLLELHWEGDQVHAGWAAGRQPPPVNAIRMAAADLAALDEAPLRRSHPLLGEVTVTPTQLSAGVARNITPPECVAMLDIRTTPAYEHAEIVSIIGEHVAARVKIYSDRLVPAETPPESRVLAAVMAARPESTPFASPTCSDWVFMRDLDAVKLGPGDSTQSHTADETIALDDVRAATELYLAVAREILK
ncbi:MAG: M20/M25/M40 family metallo-hydrolase [Thermoanaerobaculales bacterium]|jgi:acetylornithine deacetylase|nr:M20/M25/M40 family metallo-hydrolase [Thermoanaerobaculales bacterium]